MIGVDLVGVETSALPMARSRKNETQNPFRKLKDAVEVKAKM